MARTWLSQLHPRAPLAFGRLTALTACLCLSACSGETPDLTSGTETDGDDGGITDDQTKPDGKTETDETTDTPTSSDTTDNPFETEEETPNPACNGVKNCYPIDLLFVIDNSGTMGEEQLNLAKNFSGLLEELLALTDADGMPVLPSINLMVTTTDVNHPLCALNQPEDYEPALGSPVAEACVNRLDDFTARDTNPESFPEACTDTCANDKFLPSPQDFIHFGPEGKDSNVPMDKITEALNCIGPQGINGCGYESPLEAMIKAIDPNATWNQGEKPFLREGATLAIAMVTDEADCSVLSPAGFDYFTKQEHDDYWEVDPLTGNKEVSSAVCWNAGVECTGEKDGVYTECHSVDNGVLQPVSRYIDRLQSFVAKEKEVIMLGILGVPEVTKHSDKPPFEPLEGGVRDLVYRNWTEADILPGAKGELDTPEGKQWEFGIGPGCTREETGQAVPPVRVKEVCESLNRKDKKGNDLTRCCIESICDDDFRDAIKCLSGLIQITPPPG